MNLYCIKCSEFTKTNNIKTRREKDKKFNIYSQCTQCGF